VTSTARSVETQKGDARKEEILAAALEVFSDLGFTKATTKRIADAAGLRSPALIYWYFKNKEELLQAVFLRYARVLRTGTDATSAAPDAPPDEMLRRVALAGLTFFSDPQVRRIYRLFMQEWPMLEKLGIGLRTNELRDNIYAFMERYFADQIARGNLREHNPAASARAFVSQIWTQVEARYLFPSIYPEPPDDEIFVEEMVTMLLHGLLPVS